jgi:peptide/nickel transport system substrate-binding protein
LHATALAALSAPALAAAQARSGPRADLVVAVQDNPPQLDPLRLQTNVTLRVAHNIYDTPLRVDYGHGFARVPALAERWSWIDERTLEVAFRRGVKFHDGGEMTAEDVAFTFGPQRMAPEGLPGSGLARLFFGTLERVDVVDRSTVRFVTRTPDPLFEMRLASWGSQVISREAFARVGDWDRWALAPVATGPYKLAEVRTGELIRLVAHDDYWGGRPPFASVTFRVVPEAASRANGLLAGDFAIATEINPDQFAQLRARPELAVAGGPILNIRCLNFGSGAGPLRDPRIRRALAAAIDRDLIARTLYDGLVDVPQGFQWPAYGDMFIADWPKPAYDPDQAKQLLREAGYRGEPIPYRTQNNYYTAEIATAQALAGMWQDVGLAVELRIAENWTQVYAQPNDAIFNGSANMIYPDLMGALWPFYGPTGFIRTQAHAWNNQEFVEIGQRLAARIDRDERKRLHRRVLEIFDRDDPPSTPLHFTGMFYGKRRDVAWQPYPWPAMDFGPFNPALAAP